MWRRWGWLGIALFVVADVVLIVLALQHTRTAPAAESGVRTSQSGALSPSMTSSMAAPSPLPFATTTDLSAQAGTSQSTTGSSAPSSRESTTTSPPEPAATATTASDAGSAAVLMDMASDGTVVRAVRGACHTDASPSASPAAVETSGDWGATWTTVAVDVASVERVAAGRDGKSWFVATGENCEPVEHDAAANGAHWTESSPDGAWALAVDVSARSILAPSGMVDIGCAPRSLAAIDSHRAVVACAGGDIETTTGGGASWDSGAGVPGVVSVSFVGEQTGYALAAGDGCAAQVFGTRDGAQSWSKLACLPGRAAQAITAAGDTVLAQVDGKVQRSDDKGVTWR